MQPAVVPSAAVAAALSTVRDLDLCRLHRKSPDDVAAQLQQLPLVLPALTSLRLGGLWQAYVIVQSCNTLMLAISLSTVPVHELAHCHRHLDAFCRMRNSEGLQAIAQLPKLARLTLAGCPSDEVRGSFCTSVCWHLGAST